MKDKELLIRQNPETGLWEEYKEPYMTIECQTEEDYLQLEKIFDYWKSRPQWISVEERLPKRTMPPKDVLVYHDLVCGMFIDRAWYSCEKNKWVSNLGMNLKVTHWMPLPEPPEEANHDL